MKNETAHKALDTFLDAVALPFKAATDFLDQTTATMKPGLGFGVPSLRAVRFQPGHPENTEMSGAHFAILGEFGNTKHYLLLCVATGVILPGMFHIDRLEAIPEAEL